METRSSRFASATWSVRWIRRGNLYPTKTRPEDRCRRGRNDGAGSCDVGGSFRDANTLPAFSTPDARAPRVKQSSGAQPAIRAGGSGPGPVAEVVEIRMV